MAYQNPYVKIKPKIKSPYTIIYLIRHGNPDYSLEKKLGDRQMPLSDIGLVQRRFLTKRLMKMDIQKIYASELVRAQQTAELFAKKSGGKIIVDKRLDEIDWREWRRVKYFNMSEKTRERRLKGYLKMDAELDEMQTITRRLVADICHDNKGKRVALFCHGNIIKSILTGILNADIIGFLCMEIHQSSISKLVIDRDGFVKINYINSLSHLPHEPNEDIFITLVD